MGGGERFGAGACSSCLRPGASFEEGPDEIELFNHGSTLAWRAAGIFLAEEGFY